MMKSTEKFATYDDLSLNRLDPLGNRCLADTFWPVQTSN